jgi:DedD protein
MDDALKARLIGASILVVLAVALLPELLSGPKNPASEAPGGNGTRVVTIDLGGAVEASRAPRPDAAPAPATATPSLPTIAAPAATAPSFDDTSEPEAELPVPQKATVPPAAASPKPAAPDKAVPPASAATQKADTAVESAPKPSAAGGKYAVQVGAFNSPDGARKLAADLRSAGFSAYVIQPAPGKKLHRVRVGPVADRAAADQLAKRLKARGLPVAVTSDG